MLKSVTIGPSLILALLLVPGCGTTRTTTTARTGTEQLVLTQAWDTAVRQVDFSGLAGVPVYLEPSTIKGVDEGWITSSLRQAMLEAGALLKTKPEEATWIVEARVGAYGTDDSNFMIGVPQMTVPSLMPGVPGATVPEVALMKKSRQKGMAKLAIFAYDRKSGQLAWTSGTSQATANARDLYVGGMGPIQTGNIRRDTEFLDIKVPLADQPPKVESGLLPPGKVELPTPEKTVAASEKTPTKP
jgi:hypothetical protein